MSKKFKVLLINPSYLQKPGTTMGVVFKAMENKPPLGILSLGTYLKKYSNFEVKLLDNQTENLDSEGVISLISEYKPNIIGISVVSFKLNSAYLLTKTIKESFPEIHLSWGGPHLSVYPKESLSLFGVDSIVLGDGEIPFLELCKNLSQGKSIQNIKYVYSLKNIKDKKIKFENSSFPNLNELPIPDLTLLPYQKYRSFLTNAPLTTVVTSRGCPYHCIFCNLGLGSVRLMSTERIIELVKKYLSLGVKEIEFYDETFNLSPERVINFSQKVIENKLNFKWSFRGRIDKVNKEMFQVAKKAGCQRIQFGVEAGTDRILKVLKKGTDTDQIKTCFDLANKFKIDTVAYFILGNPRETIKEMEQTIMLANEINPTFLEYSIFNISPGTESYKIALKKKVINKDYWRQFALDPEKEMPVLYWEDKYSFKEIEKLRKKALFSFYFSPSYLVKRIIRIKLVELPNMFAAFLGIISDSLVKK